MGFIIISFLMKDSHGKAPCKNGYFDVDEVKPSGNFKSVQTLSGLAVCFVFARELHTHGYSD